jgi:ferredoxin
LPKSKPAKKTAVPLHLNIDYALCQGCGGCAEAFPQYFEFRDDKAWIINADSFTEKDKDGVLHVCPYYAISVEEVARS